MNRNIKPRYEVERLDGEVVETRIKRDAEKGMNVEYETVVPLGFMVYFANGNSIRVKTEAELIRLGFDVPAPLIDMDSGEEVGTTESLSLRRQHARRAVRSDTGAIDANQGA